MRLIVDVFAIDLLFIIQISTIFFLLLSTSVKIRLVRHSWVAIFTGCVESCEGVIMGKLESLEHGYQPIVYVIIHKIQKTRKGKWHITGKICYTWNRQFFLRSFWRIYCLFVIHIHVYIHVYRHFCILQWRAVTDFIWTKCKLKKATYLQLIYWLVLNKQISVSPQFIKNRLIGILS